MKKQVQIKALIIPEGVSVSLIPEETYNEIITLKGVPPFVPKVHEFTVELDVWEA